jgi:hypothetical protein
MTDTVHTEIYTHKSGKKYSVVWYYDNDSGSPLEDDGYGVTERLDWNPTDSMSIEQWVEDDEPGIEEETRMRMMRMLCRPSNRYDSGLFYDVLTSLHVARKEWGIADPVKAMEVVEKDYAFLKGWFDDDWHWLTLGVAPLDENDEPIEEDREYCSRYESTILDNEEYKVEAIENQIGSIEYVLHQRLHKDQLQLDLRAA